MASYFSHDSNARNDDKILSLRMRHGWEGYGLYWALIERMREAANYACVCDYNVVAYDLRTDAAKIKSIIEDYGLFAFEAGTDGRKYVYSESLRRRMSAVDDLSEKRSNAGKKGMASRWGNSENVEDNNNVITGLYQSDKDVITRKLNKNKINNNSSTTSTSTARVKAENIPENFSKKIPAADENANGAVSRDEFPAAVNLPPAARKTASAAENARKCLESPAWIESVCMQNHITPERVAEEMRLFPSHLTEHGYDDDKTIDDFKRHFAAMLRKKLASESRRIDEKTNNQRKNEGIASNGKPQGGGDPWSDYRSRHGLG